MLDVLCEFCRAESGAAAIEYGLIAALVSVAAFVGMAAAGQAVDGLLQTVAQYLSLPD